MLTTLILDILFLDFKFLMVAHALGRISALLPHFMQLLSSLLRYLLEHRAI